MDLYHCFNHHCLTLYHNSWWGFPFDCFNHQCFTLFGMAR